ncbi:MAG: DUF814 domain-containing protein [Acidobacteria bacterium]|nr:DUF814 domain-containing protein [Acidobacteriota bacterium]
MELGLLRHLLDELRPQLVGTRTDRIYAVPRYDLAIEMASRRHYLWISLDPNDPHLCHRRRGPRTENRPPAFAMAARKWARGQSLLSIELVNDDRVVRVEWSGGGALIAELVPRRATALVLDSADQIVAVWNPRKGRPGVGELYEPPPRAPRSDAAAADATVWERLFNLPTRELQRALVREFDGMTPTLAAEVMYRAPDSAETLRTTVLQELEASLAPPEPRIYSAAPLTDLREPAGLDKLLCSPRALKHREHQCVQTAGSVSDATRSYYDLLANLRLVHQARESVRSAVDKRLGRLRRRLEASPSDVSAGRLAILRQHADCLLAAPGAAIEDGVARVPDVYGDGRTIDIKVDPAMSLADNAQSLYRRAQRLEERSRQAERDAEQLGSEIESLQSLRREADLVRDSSQATSLMKKAAAAGLEIPLERMRLAEAGTGHLLAAEAPTQPQTAGILTVTTVAGYEILVGRSATHNDRLTHQVAQPHDWWLHAEGPGSHVVLRNPRRLEQPPQDALAAAASLAAWFSKARSAGKVEVKWTAVKRVRKPRGAPAGLAVLDQHHTFVVAPRPPAEVGQAPGD